MAVTAIVGWVFAFLASQSGDALGEQLESRKLVDRAKGILMDECGYKEQDAFTFIQRTAMSERCRMRDVAERLRRDPGAVTIAVTSPLRSSP